MCLISDDILKESLQHIRVGNTDVSCAGPNRYEFFDATDINTSFRIKVGRVSKESIHTGTAIRIPHARQACDLPLPPIRQETAQALWVWDFSHHPERPLTPGEL